MVPFRFLLNIFSLLYVTKCSVFATGNIVCYYRNSYGYKVAPPETLDPNLCTHIIYAFVTADENGNLTVQNKRLDIDLGLYNRTVALKLINPSLKVLLSVGSVQAKVFSSIAADDQKRQNFVESSKYFLATYSFDGLDIDWEKPNLNDTDNFILLLSDLKKKFVDHGWLLTAAVYPNPSAGYNVTEMAKHLDIYNVMCYNYYGPWSPYTGQNSPLFASSIESSYQKKNLNIAASMQNWINAGAPKEKLVIGLAFYGRALTLVDPKQHGLHAPIVGAGTTPSTPTYSQICSGYSNWTTVWDDEQKNPYKYLNDQWLGYDNKRSIKEKVEYVVSQKVRGVMIWHIGGDDMKGKCGSEQGLLKLINSEMQNALGRKRGS